MNGAFQFWWWRNFGLTTGACVCARNWWPGIRHTLSDMRPRSSRARPFSFS